MLSAGVAPERIRDELIALLFAGYDSTATALAATLALVGDHPDVQARLREELAEAPDEGGPESIGAGDRPYLDAVVRESLRLYPPQYLLFREPSEAVTLGGYRVEAGTTVVLSPWLCGRDGAHWDAPAQFRPERWLSERDRPRFAYFPYGGGPRYCLGRRLAERTIRTVVSVVCRRRALRLPGDLSVSAGPTLSLEPSDAVTAVERDGGVVSVTADGRTSEESRRATYVLSRAPDADGGHPIVTEQAYRRWPLRDALAHAEDGVDEVRLRAPTGTHPPFGVQTEESPTVAYDGTTWRVSVEGLNDE
jgi:hypothetical protein